MGKKLPLDQVKPLRREGIGSAGDIGLCRVPNGARLLRVCLLYYRRRIFAWRRSLFIILTPLSANAESDVSSRLSSTERSELGPQVRICHYNTPGTLATAKGTV